MDSFFFSSTCGSFFFFRKVLLMYVTHLWWMTKKRHLKINGLFFFFDFLFYFCRRCWSGDGDFSLAEKQRQHITGTMTKKPMMKTKQKELSLVWCHCYGWNVSGLEKKLWRFVLFVLDYVCFPPPPAVRHKAKYTNKTCAIKQDVSSLDTTL